MVEEARAVEKKTLQKLKSRSRTVVKQVSHLLQRLCNCTCTLNDNRLKKI